MFIYLLVLWDVIYFICFFEVKVGRFILRAFDFHNLQSDDNVMFVLLLNKYKIREKSIE